MVAHSVGGQESAPVYHLLVGVRHSTHVSCEVLRALEPGSCRSSLESTYFVSLNKIAAILSWELLPYHALSNTILFAGRMTPMVF